MSEKRVGREMAMSIAKVIEVLAEGETLEGAMESAVSEAAKSVRNIRHLYVEGIQAKVEDDQIVKYRIDAKLTFVVD
jgi:flavin-binding protein dodecin